MPILTVTKRNSLMPTDHTPNSAVLTTRLASLAALLAVVVGATVLVGCAFDIASLKRALRGRVACGIRAIECGER